MFPYVVRNLLSLKDVILELRTLKVSISGSSYLKEKGFFLDGVMITLAKCLVFSALNNKMIIDLLIMINDV